jgi:prephenate dehydrogenase
MLFEQITVVGVGLIGGSVGLAAKAHGVARPVVGVGRDPQTLARAVELGAIDSFTTDLAEGVRGAALVVVCTPVDTIADMILRAAPHVRAGTIFTDGGSTKGNIVAAVAGKLPRGVEYVPAHPLAGAEKNGVEHARPDLFEGRVTIVVEENTLADWEAFTRVGRFWVSLGARVISMNAGDHDRVLASTSHLPHAVASAVAGVTNPDWLPLSAGGFRDVTRIAAGDPKLWAAIFQANREPVLAALVGFTDRMDEFKRLLAAGDHAGLVRWLTEGKQVRDALGS